MTGRAAQQLDAYEQQDGLGYLRHLVVREGIRTGEVLCILVTSPGEYPDFEALQELLAERCPTVVGVLHAVNEGTADSTQGLAARVAFGRGWFEEELLGLRLRVSAGSFMQTNTEMTDLLYAEAVRRAALTGDEIVWDLYSGIGSIALALAGGAARVIGVEIVEEAVERARENALLNGVANAEFVVGDAAKAIRPLLEEGLPRPGCGRRRPAAGRPDAARGAPRGRALPEAARVRLVQPDDARRQRQAARRGRATGSPR